MSKNKAKSVASPINTQFYSRWFPIVLLVLGFFIYSNTLKHEYAQDDDIYTRKNTFIQKGISAFPDLVKQGSLVGFDGTNVSDYRPLVLINFALEKSLFGNNPKANHFFNVLFYALACILLYRLLVKLFPDFPPYLPALMALLFLFHPIHTEVVANIKSRDELLCFLFGILTLSAAFDAVQTPNKTKLILAAFYFFLCLLCKENGFTYLGIIPLILYFFTNANWKKIATVTLICFGVALINLAIRWSVLDALMLNKSLVLMDNSLMAASNYPEQLATVFTMLLKALILLIFPLNLSYDYSYNQFPIVSWSNVEALLSFGIYLSLVVFAIYGIRKKSIFSFCILFFLIAYSMTSNVFFKIGSSFAERFLFAPSLSICIALPLLFALIMKLDVKQTPISQAGKLIGTTAVILLLFGIRTQTRNEVWKNNTTLFASGVESAPNSARAQFAYANGFREIVEASPDMNQKMDASKSALSAFNAGLAIYDKDERIYYNIGVIYFNINEIEKAKEAYLKAIKIKADYPEALNNLGVIYFNAKEYPQAMDYFKKAVAANANYNDAFANLGASYHNMGDVKSAIPYYEKAIQIKPTSGVLRNLSMAYGTLGDSTKANYYANQAGLY